MDDVLILFIEKIQGILRVFAFQKLTDSLPL